MDQIVQLIEEDIEEPEGLDIEPELEGDYPIDEFLIRTDHRTVFDIVRRMRQPSSPYIQPDFQRNFVWDERKQSKLIESALLRIPLPVFYLAEREDGKIVIVDGLQRLTTFLRFLNNDFALQGVNNRSLLGKKFDDLPIRFQDRIENTNLILYLLDARVPEQARLEIFERVNSGEPLSRQQMRNALYDGPATRWLLKQANSDEFKIATTNSLSRKTMRDREFINRFCAFYVFGYERYERNYKGDMDLFLADVLKQMNKESTNFLSDLEMKFRRSMQHNEALFGRYAFRRHVEQDVADMSRRSVINAALFDVWSVIMAKYPAELSEQHENELNEVFYELIVDDDFIDAIRISTNSSIKVVKRFEMVETRLERLEC